MLLGFRAAVFAAALVCIGVAHAGPAPLEAYGSLPSLSDIRLSPDGHSLAYVKGNTAKRFIVIVDLATGKVVGAINVSGHKLRDLLWADNTHLVLTISSTQAPDDIIGSWREYWQALWYDTKTKTQHNFFQNVKTADGHAVDDDFMNVIAGPLQPRVVDGQAFIFFQGFFFRNGKSGVALFREDLTDNTCVLFANLNDRYDPHTDNWLIDGMGNIVAAEGYYKNAKLWKLNTYHDGKAVTVLSIPVNVDIPGIVGLSADGSAIVVDLPQPEGDDKYEQVSLKDDSVSSWGDGGHVYGFPMVDERTGRVIGRSVSGEKSNSVYFDPKTAMTWNIVKTVFKDAINADIVSASQDRTKVVVHAFGQRYGDGYFLLDLAAKSAKPIGDEYTGISEVSPVRWIDYKARDGRTIHAYLTLPLGRDAKNLPLIVLPHGGPHARDEPGFDWWSQALASRGYAVLQPEFRGSSGFGADLLTAGFGEFGKKMQTDLSDGVQALATQGTIDPKRVCIAGASYGGYAALAGVALQSGIYRCAVSVDGISDLGALLEYWGWPNGSLDDPNERFWDRFLGVSGPNDKRLNLISPIKHVAAVTVPVLLIHGDRDTVSNISQSRYMAAALRHAGKSVQLVVLEGEDHWLSHNKTRIQMLEATVKFLEANDPPN